MKEINKNYTLSKETRYKIHLARIGKPLSEEHKKRISQGIRNSKKYWDSRNSLTFKEKCRLGRLGKKHTEEAKKLMSISNNTKERLENYRKWAKENKHKLQRIGKLNGMYGRKHTEEELKLMSEHRKGKCCKENHPLWKGGQTWKNYPEQFVKFNINVFKRDGFKCKICGAYRGKGTKRIVRHHIDYNKQNCNENNLITLCNSHHAKTTNGDRNYWQNYLTKLIGATNEIK